MKLTTKSLALLIGTAGLIPILAFGAPCVYGWKETLCMAHSGRCTAGSCSTTPVCPDWTTPCGNYYNYPCTEYDKVLLYCEEFNYTATYTQHSYVSGTQNCPTTCGTEWSPGSISTTCIGQDYEYNCP